MDLKTLENPCFITALFIRDDGNRFLLGSGVYEFKDEQLHFNANEFQNDIVEVQGNDGVLLAGQVRRATDQTFEGYIGDGTIGKEDIENYRRDFFTFFRKNHYYKVVYILPSGGAIQRRRGFIVGAPEVKELWQLFPEYSVSLNFEDVNYYTYDEDEQGEEVYGESLRIPVTTTTSTGGLIWSGYEDATVSGSGSSFTLSGYDGVPNITDVQLKGDTTQSGTPTPTNPQTVNVVTGEQTVKVYKKNLFDTYGDVSYHYGTVDGTVTNNMDGTITTTANGGSYRGTGQLITGLTPGQDYTISAKMVSTTSTRPTQGYIGVYRGGTTTPISGGNLTFNTSNPQKSGTFTLPAGVSSIWVTFMSNGAGSETTYSNIQVEVGSPATDYEAGYPQTYTVDLGSIELCKIGDYQDKIYKSGDDWYVRKEISKLELDGSSDESWSISNTGTSSFYYLARPIPDGDISANITTSDGLISNYGTAAAVGNSGTTQGIMAVYSTGKSYIRIRYGTEMALSDWETKLSSSPMIVYYALATPTDTQITDASLIAELEALAGADCYAVQTNFSVTASGLPGILAVEAGYIEYGGVEWDNIGAVWEPGGGGGPTVVNINSVDNVYPIWEVVGPTDTPILTILTTNTTIKYNAAIIEGQTLRVDMFNRIATLNGVNVLNKIVGDEIYLAPGTNKITYATSQVGDGPCTISWQGIVG